MYGKGKDIETDKKDRDPYLAWLRRGTGKQDRVTYLGMDMDREKDKQDRNPCMAKVRI